MQYRADIDGLRGLAVLAVVAFHAAPLGLPGGFIGVDVFFVISGFLITHLILSGTRTGTFSILNFYERRARRLLPALAVVLIFCLAFAALTMLPADFERFGASLRDAATFVANHRFAKVGYFDDAADAQPLLHLWSLSVEEQFYLLFPLLMILAHRWGMCGFVIAALLAGSFFASVTMISAEPRAVFFLLHFRAWELLVGAALAAGLVPSWKGAPALTAGSGLVLIIGSALLYSEAIPFPGFAALGPCIGATLVIQGGREANFVSKALSWPPLVCVGLFSYSLYLWHWPLLVYARSTNGGDLSSAKTAVVVVAAMLLSIATWILVERPFRRRSALPSRTGALAASAIILSAFFAAGVATVATDGFPTRWPQRIQAILRGEQDVNPRQNECGERALDPCVIGRSGLAPTFAVIGDSYAAAMWPAIGDEAREAGKSGVVLTRNGCKPLLGTSIARSHIKAECINFYDAVARYLDANQTLTTVLIVAKWPVLKAVEEVGNPSATSALVQRGLSNLIDALPGRTIFITSPIPVYPSSVPVAIAKSILAGKPLPSSQAADFRATFATTTAILESTAATRGARVLDVGSPLCQGGTCITMKDGKPLYHDDDHLSLSGASVVQPVFKQVFSPALRTAGTP